MADETKPKTTLTYGSITAFNKDDDWDLYQEQAEQYFEANLITDGSQKRAIFLACYGQYLYSLIRTLISPALPKDKTLTDLFQTVTLHLKPKPSMIVCRSTFNKATRRSDEGIAEFSNRLRHLEKDCQYGDQLNDMLRDRFVVAINDDRMERRLLSGKTLTFTRAFDLALAIETAGKNVQTIHEPETAIQEPVQFINPTKNSRTKSYSQAGSKDFTCQSCGSNHDRKNCKFRDAKCFNCNKSGHISTVCRSAKR